MKEGDIVVAFGYPICKTWFNVIGTCIRDGQYRFNGCFQQSSDNQGVRLATPDEIEAYKQGIRHVKDVRYKPFYIIY